MRMSLACCCGSSDIATLKCWDPGTGEQLWEHVNLRSIARDANGSVYAYRWRKVGTGDYPYIKNYMLNVTLNAAYYFDSFGSWGGGASSNRFQTKNKALHLIPPVDANFNADMVRIDIDGTMTVLVDDCIRASFNTGDRTVADIIDVNTTQQLSSSGTTFLTTRQNQNASVDGHMLNPFQITAPIIECEELWDETNDYFKFKILPWPVQSRSDQTGRWFMKTGTEEIFFPLYATAAEVKSAFESFSFVESAVVTGGPTFVSAMSVHLTYTSGTDEIQYIGVEYSAPVEKFIFDLNTYAPYCVFGYPRNAGSTGTEERLTFKREVVTMCSSGRAVLAKGTTILDGTSGWARYEYAGGFPYGTWAITPTWERVLFKNKNQLQMQVTDAPSSLYSGPGSLVASAHGKCAFASASRNAGGTNPYTTHYILFEASGAILEDGWSGFMAATEIHIHEDGSTTGCGIRSGGVGGHYDPMYVDPYRCCPVTNLITGWFTPPAYASPSGVTGFTGGAPVTDDQEVDYTMYAGPLGNIDAYYSYGFYKVRSGSMVFGTAKKEFASPHSSVRWIYSQVEMLGTSILPAPTAEFRLRMNTSTGTGGLATNWMPWTATNAEIQAELDALFGPDLLHVDISPRAEDISANMDYAPWVRMGAIGIDRDNLATPNPFDPLIPRHINYFLIDVRGQQVKANRHLVRYSPTTGELLWQRHTGKSYYAPGYSAGYPGQHGVYPTGIISTGRWKAETPVNETLVTGPLN